MANRKIAGMLLVLAVSILSCKKDSESPAAIDKKLVVNLNNHLIAVSDIDSANVVLRKSGSNNPFFFRLQKGTDKLEALIDGLPAGQYTVDVDLYTNEMPSGQYYQFVQTKAVTLSSTSEPITIEGPDDLGGDGWSARKVAATSSRDIVVLIPLDVTDPYFEIRANGAAYNFVGVERIALQNSGVVAHKNWQCNTGNCWTNGGRLIFDKTTFVPFTNIIKNEAWTKNEIIITVGNSDNQQYNEFGHVWTN